MYMYATSPDSDPGKYSDKGVVDLGGAYLESVRNIDGLLVSRGYISKAGYEHYLNAVRSGDPSLDYFHSNPNYIDSITKARLNAYYVDEFAPARLRDGARAAAKSERNGMFFIAAAEIIGTLFPPVRSAKLRGATPSLLGRFVDKVVGLTGLLSKYRNVEGRLASHSLIPGNGIRANRKQRIDFKAEVERYGYRFIEVAEGGESFVSHRGHVVQMVENPDLGVMLDEFSHLWNGALARHGAFLPDDLAAIHKRMGGKGTRYLTPAENTLYHQLEVANMWYSGHKSLPSFVRAVPRSQIRLFISETRAVAKELGLL